jgi:hypothetical protein
MLKELTLLRLLMNVRCKESVEGKLYINREFKHFIPLILELGLWCLTLLSAIFQLHRGGQFY